MSSFRFPSSLVVDRSRHPTRQPKQHALAALEPFIWSLASKTGHKHRYLPLYLWGVLCILVRDNMHTHVRMGALLGI